MGSAGAFGRRKYELKQLNKENGDVDVFNS